MRLRRLQHLDLNSKKALVRLDLNVPIEGGVIQDDTRIRAAVPTLKYVLEKTHRVAVCSHLGRPKGERTPKFSLEPVAARLAELLGREVIFVSEYIDEPLDLYLDRLQPNQFVVLENLRFYPGETDNSPEFAQILARGFDIFINDAFGTVHRSHASVVGVTEFIPPEQRAAGYLIEKEVQALGHLLQQPRAPFSVIMGGAKVSDKIAVILNLINRANNFLIGGAMAYSFLAYRGVGVGKSRVERDQFSLLEKIYRNAESRRVTIHLPVDHVCAEEFAENAEAVAVEQEAIPDHLMGLDIGPKTARLYSDVIADSQTVLWNGPMGVFEWRAFSEGTRSLAHAVAGCSGETVVGGGDSVSALNQANLAGQIKHVSTGGGASLEYLEGTTLPGIKVLLD